MSEKKHKKKNEFQKKMISMQAERIELLKSQIEKLKLELKEKDDVINSVAVLRQELAQNIDDIKTYKKQYKAKLDELRKMEEIMNHEVFRGRWNLIKFLLK